MLRFERLAAGEAGLTKLCHRGQVNPSLTSAEIVDEDLFLRGLRARLGEPDHVGDERYSYSIQDLETGVLFEAYCAQSGPAYGGSLECFADLETGRLKEPVIKTLSAFDQWIHQAALEGM